MKKRNMDRTVCRLCLNLIVNDECENLEDMQKGMLAVIIPEFNLDLPCNPNVICKKCSELLLNSYEFKSACMENIWRKNCDNTEVIIKDSERLLETIKKEVPDDCCLCGGEIDEDVLEAESSLLNMKLKKCLPELECLSGKICQACRTPLEMLFTFVTACLYAETNISNYVSQKSSKVTEEINLYKIYEHYSLMKLENGSASCHDLFHINNAGPVKLEPVSENGNMEFGLVEKGVNFVAGTQQPEQEGDPLRKREISAEPKVEVEWEPLEPKPLAVNNITAFSLSSGTISNTQPSVQNIYFKTLKENMYKCKECNFKTKHKFSIRRHYSMHITTPSLQISSCELCAFTTRHRSLLTEHMATHVEPTQMKLGKNEVFSPAMDLLLYTCNRCPFKTKYKQNLCWHMLTHKYETVEMKPLLTCGECNFQTKYERSFKTHMKKRHNS